MIMNLMILAVSLLILYVYSGFRGKNRYFSGRGVVLFILLSVLVFIKIKSLGVGRHLITQNTIPFFINAGVTALAALMLRTMKTEKASMPLRETLLLFLLYIPFAFVEQILFLFVFSETLFAITGNIFISSVLSSVYFQEFHPNKMLGRNLYLMYAISLVWTAVYLLYGNIVWPSLSLAVLGPLYYYFLFGKSRFSVSDLFE